MTMPAVVTYWQLPDEEEAFLDYLESTGTVLALPDHWVKSKNDMSPCPIREFLEKHDPDGLLFGLEEHLSNLTLEQMEYKGEHGFNSPSAMETSVLLYTRPRIRDEQRLGQSNLAAYWTCLDERQSRIIDKNPDFVRWGKRVFAWVRRPTPEWFQYRSYRATKRAKKAFEDGVVELVQ